MPMSAEEKARVEAEEQALSSMLSGDATQQPASPEPDAASAPAPPPPVATPPPPPAAAEPAAEPAAEAASSAPEAEADSSSAPTPSPAPVKPPPTIKPPPPIESVRGTPLSDEEARKFTLQEEKPVERKIIMEALLQKKSPGSFITLYQDRYFLLWTDKLEYYKTAKDAKKADQKPQGSIPLFAVKQVVHLGRAKNKPLRFDVVVGDGGVQRKFELQTSSAAECDRWVDAINQAIIELDKYSSPNGAETMTSQSKKDAKFWKNAAAVEERLNSPSIRSKASMQADGPPSSPGASTSPTSGSSSSSGITSPSASAAAASPAASPNAASSCSTTTAPADGASGSSGSSTAALTSLPISLQLVRMMMKDPSGSGSGSVVFLAVEKGSSSNFYLVQGVRKGVSTPDPKAIKALETQSKLRCPYLPRQIYAGNTLDFHFSIVQPAVRVQDSLLHYLTLYRRLPEEVTRSIGAQVVALLHYLHSHPSGRIVARTLCTDNLYVDGSGRVVFVDFNLTPQEKDSVLSPTTSAATGRSNSTEEKLVDAGLVPEYTTPEFCRGEPETNMADFWRLGVLLYELAVGIPPIRASPQQQNGSGSAAAEAGAASAARRAKCAEIHSKLQLFQPDELRFPPFVSEEFQAFIRELLQPNPFVRLGCKRGATDVMSHGYWGAGVGSSFQQIEWDDVLLADGPGAVPLPWIQEKALATTPNREVIIAQNPQAVPEHIEHMCLAPPPVAPELPKPTRRNALHVAVLGARGLNDGFAGACMNIDLKAVATGDNQSNKVSSLTAPDATWPPQTCAHTFDYTNVQEQSAAGELNVAVEITPFGGSPSSGHVTVPLSSIAALQKALYSTPEGGLDAAGLNMAVTELLREAESSASGPASGNDVSHPPTPQWYSVLDASGMVMAELQLLLTWVDLRLPSVCNKSVAPTVNLSQSLIDAFGRCASMDESSGTGLVFCVDNSFELESEITKKFHTPGTRGRGSVYGSVVTSVRASSAAIPVSKPSAVGLADDGEYVRPVDLGRTSIPAQTAQVMPSNMVEGDVDDDDDDDDDEEDEAEAAAAADQSKDSTSGNAASNMLRGLVSKKKLRYQQDGFDLDLSYITPRIIAMGFPSEGAESVYRNPMSEVQRFFASKHPGAFRIYNLCSERKYQGVTKFGEGRVVEVPFNDHNAPKFECFLQFCMDAHNFLKQDPKHVVAIHCKAGKGRTGTLIAALLLFEQRCADASEALNYFGLKRTSNGKGVTIPSQRRYVHYFADFLQQYTNASGQLRSDLPLAPTPVPLRLKRIRLYTVPNFDIGGGCDPYFIVKGGPPAEERLYDYRQALKKRGLKVQAADKNAPTIDMDVPGDESAAAAAATSYVAGSVCDVTHGCIVAGDVKFAFYDQDTVKGDDAMFHLWINTSFIAQSGSYTLKLTKSECDKAVKDKKCEKFNKEFAVEFTFEPLQQSAPSPAPAPSA